MSASRVFSIIGVIAFCCVWADIAIWGEQRLPVRVADGLYFNRCCGTLGFNSGQMSIGNQRISYVVERDKVSAYVVSKVYTGASDTGFVVKPNAYAMKLRLDNPSNPHCIKLLDVSPDATSYSYSFERKNGS